MEEVKMNKLLVVDDLRANILVLTHILGSDYDVYTATSGAEALDCVEKVNPDVILLDILMPEMNGYEVIAKLKHNEKTRDIPVIFITSLTEIGAEEHGLSLGAADYIPKPFSSAIVKLRVQLQIDILTRLHMTEQMKNEVAEAKKHNKAKTQFLATMSHEIRTPMSSIMGFAELALEQATSKQNKVYLNKILDSTRWLMHIIDDILDISKIEAGKFELQSEPFLLRDVFEQCKSVISTQATKKNLLLKFSTDMLHDRLLLGDPLRLYQILLNLLSNAVKFTPKGFIELSSHITQATDDSVKISFKVSDCGIGLTAEQAEVIFEPFVQADSGTTRTHGGTGLGLAIAARLVEMMGGKLEVESEFGVGSTFSFDVSFTTIDASSEVLDLNS
jgi:signal transduction histidine kinase